MIDCQEQLQPGITSSPAGAIKELFEWFLLSNGPFAIDGCTISSNAAKEWLGTFNKENGALLAKNLLSVIAGMIGQWWNEP